MATEGRKKDKNYYYFDLERDGLDKSLGQCIPKGTLMLITGPYGTGKSVLCQRFAYGFIEHNLDVNVISTENYTKGFLDQMDSLDYPVKPALLDRQLKFVPVFPLLGKSGARQDFLSRLKETEQLYDSDVVMIDTLSALIEEDMDEDRAIDTISFFKKVCGKGKVIIITMDPEETQDEVLVPFKSASDIYLELSSETIEGTTEHSMYVRRFTTAKARTGDVINFRVEPGAGFIVDITAVSS